MSDYFRRSTYVNIDAFEIDDGTVYVKSSRDRIPERYVPAAEWETVRHRLEEALDDVTLLRRALEPFARLDYDIGDEWADVCEAARAALEGSA